MGNIISSQKHQYLKTKNIKETCFENFVEVSSCLRGATIELVSDESCGKASNLLKLEKVDRLLNLNDLSEITDGWLTKRHESVASVTITLCNESKIVGFDIDTTGYTDSSPSFANVEGYRNSIMAWQAILPDSRINADSHNFFDIKDSDVYSSVRLSISPGGGVARFRVYGEISPDWSKTTNDCNLASANLGARVVRWTDQRYANNPNILLDGGTKMSDGWLTPRSRLEQERNDFILIQLATAGILESLVVDTTGFNTNSPENVFAQGCYSEDADPHHDTSASWIRLVPQSPVSPGDETIFYLDVKDPITHVRIYLMPDGGIQQIKAIGKPTQKKAKVQLLLEPSPAKKMSDQDEDAIVASMKRQCQNTSVVEELEVLNDAARTSKRIRTSD